MLLREYLGNSGESNPNRSLGRHIPSMAVTPVFEVNPAPRPLSKSLTFQHPSNLRRGQAATATLFAQLDV